MSTIDVRVSRVNIQPGSTLGYGWGTDEATGEDVFFAGDWRPMAALAEAVGKRPPASEYSADMSKHAFLGSHERIKKVQKDYADKL